MKNSYDVCMELLRAESEDEVSGIIKKTPEIDNPDNWKPLDGRDTNFGQFQTINVAHNLARNLFYLFHLAPLCFCYFSVGVSDLITHNSHRIQV